MGAVAAATWFESLAIASRPLQRQRAETNFADSSPPFDFFRIVSRSRRAVAFSEGGYDASLAMAVVLYAALERASELRGSALSTMPCSSSARYRCPAARECFRSCHRANAADGISDIEGEVARVATSKLGNERVSIDSFIAEGGKGPSLTRIWSE
jgi:hypothetical protein